MIADATRRSKRPGLCAYRVLYPTSAPDCQHQDAEDINSISTTGNEPQPDAIAHPGDRQTAHHHRRGGRDQVDQAVGCLEGGDDQIAGHTGKLRQRRHDRHRHRRQAGTRRDQERQRDVEQVHDDDEGHAAQPGDRLFRPVQHGVGDQAVVHDHGDAARHADDQRHAQHVPRPVDEGVDQHLLPQPADDADQDAEEQEAAPSSPGTTTTRWGWRDPRSAHGITP